MNIEEVFFKFKSNVFPHKKNYVETIYKVLKYNLDKDIHPEVKVKMKEYESDDYYNDHGIDHINMVIDRVSKIIECLNPVFIKKNSNTSFYISPYEIFILLMAIQIHDAGHLIGTRQEHTSKAQELLSRLDVGKLLSAGEKKIIGEIAKAHGGTDDPIGKLPMFFELSNEKIRPQFLASLLRLGDELAEDHTRASRFLIENNKIAPSSEIYHLYSLSLDSVSVEPREISLKYYMNQEDTQKKYPKRESSIFLIDEIYSRTLKTFTETLYCIRFLPENCRFNTIKVTIYVTDEYCHSVINPIAYELKETGYPFLGVNNNIFNLCEEDLRDEGKDKDGEYFASILKEINIDEKSI